MIEFFNTSEFEESHQLSKPLFLIKSTIIKCQDSLDDWIRFESNYFSQVDSELCVGCGICVKRCNMDAITIIDKKAIVDRDRCIGCGLCISTCPEEAMQLIPKKKIDILAKNPTNLYLKIWRGKTPTRKILGLAMRTILGLKLDPNYKK